jgi:hypothetical protein
MTGMLDTIIPRSDQMNADDLIGGRTIIITITGVEITMNEQPVAIKFEGDNNKPYRPGKSMRRVLVQCWGPDARVYVGRKLKLYCDPSVKFGGMEVGGIRISHMSHIKSRVTMALTATKAQRRPFTVDPLIEDDANTFAGLQEKAQEQAALGVEAYKAFFTGLNKSARDHLLPQHEALKAVATGVDAARTEGKPSDAMPPADGNSKIAFGTEAEPDPLGDASTQSMLDRVNEAASVAALTSMQNRTNGAWRQEYDMLPVSGKNRVDERVTARLAEMRAVG